MTRNDLLALAERVEQGSDYEPRLSRDVWSQLTDELWIEGDILTSIDAVEDLRKRLLPGSAATVEQFVAMRYFAAWVHWGKSAERVRSNYGRAPTEPRARLAALLRAYSETVEG